MKTIFHIWTFQHCIDLFGSLHMEHSYFSFAANSCDLKFCYAVFDSINVDYKTKEISIIEDAEPRSLNELSMMVDNCENIDDLQLLFEGLTEDEKVIITEYVNVKKGEF